MKISWRGKSGDFHYASARRPAGGILDDRRDFEVGTAEAQAVLRKGAQAAAGRRDREIADANLTLAQARSSYEVGWAQMGAEDSQWKLERSDLPIQGSDNGSITTTTTTGTQFVPGAFRMTPPVADQQANSRKTSTGFGGNELDQYFSNGFLKDGVDDQSPPGQLAGQVGTPIAQDPPNPNQVQEEPQKPDEGDDPTIDPPEQRVPLTIDMLPEGSWTIVDGDGSSVSLPSKPASPTGVLGGLPPFRDDGPFTLPGSVSVDFVGPLPSPQEDLRWSAIAAEANVDQVHHWKTEISLSFRWSLCQ